jgi:hypothetical protein
MLAVDLSIESLCYTMTHMLSAPRYSVHMPSVSMLSVAIKLSMMSVAIKLSMLSVAIKLSMLIIVILMSAVKLQGMLSVVLLYVIILSVVIFSFIRYAGYNSTDCRCALLSPLMVAMRTAKTLVSTPLNRLLTD